MKISVNQNLYSASSVKTNGIAFRSAFPVYHMIENDFGSFSPIYHDDLIRSLHKKLVRILNKEGRKPNSKYKDVIDYLKGNDNSYKLNPIVRSFYSLKRGHNWMDKKAYLITGDDVNIFNRRYADEIGRQKSYLKKFRGAPQYELDNAISNYMTKGFEFVSNLHKNKKDANGIIQSLYTEFIEKKRKDGNIDYELKRIIFMPEKRQ